MTEISTDDWYALAVNSGQEKRVRERILDRLDKEQVKINSLAIICPEEEVVVDKGKESERKKRMVLPGYLLINGRRISDDAFAAINKVQGVLGFLGGDRDPVPLPEDEVDKILGGQAQNRPGRVRKKLFDVGDEVTIIEGPLTDFSGNIISLTDEDAQVEVEIFGRRTPTAVSLRSLRRA